SSHSRSDSLLATGAPASPRPSSPAKARPTTNQVPPATASQPPSIAVARLRETISISPPSATTAPGSTCSQPRPTVHVHGSSGVNAKSTYGPTNGISAPHRPSSSSSNPV